MRTLKRSARDNSPTVKQTTYPLWTLNRVLLLLLNRLRLFILYIWIYRLPTVGPYVLHQLSSLLDQAIFSPWVDLFLAHPISLYHDLNLWRLTKGQATTARAGFFIL